MARARLSVLFDEVQGSVGNTVVVSRQGTTYVRARPAYRRPEAPSQVAQAQRMKAAAYAWAGLTPEQARAWDVYAQTLAHPADKCPPSGFNAFARCALCTLMADPAASPAPWPPSSAFMGDGLTLSLAAAGSGKAPHPDEAGDQAPSTTALLFTASAPNTPGVLTELRVQHLPNPRRKPNAQYRSAAFVAFTDQRLTAEVPVDPGTYAAAYRFVKPETGQSTTLVPVATVTVPSTD